jgi:peptide/nickel transport system substrate-binding protein
MNRNRFVAAAIVAALLCGCTKAGQTTVANTTTLTIADGSGDITSLNPHLFTEIPLGYIAEMSQAYLVKYDAQNRPYPELLTIIPTLANGGISKDGHTITWHLRHGVRWSDGAPFNGDDLVFSTQVVLNPANNEVGRDGWNLITKVDEPDKYTVVYHLKQAYSPFIPTFFGSAGANPDILPKHLLAKYPNINSVPYNAKPVGIGPFRVVVWKRADSVELEANPYYFRGTPKLQHIIYKLIPSTDTLLTLLQTGEVELWPQLGASYIARAKAVPNIQTDVTPGVFFPHFDFNVTRPLVSDIRVREAIRYAINRDEIVQKVSHGYAKLQESMVPNTIPFAPRDIPLIPYDPAKARALLDQAGWKMGPGGVRVKNGERLALQLPYSNGVATADSIMELVRAYLRAVGIEIDTRKWAPAMLFAPYQNGGIIYGGKWDMTFFSWQGLPNTDISNLLECNQIPPNGQNVLHYCNPQVDKLLEEIKRTYDMAQQTKLLDEEQRIVVRDVPTIVLYVGDIGYAHNPNLTGYEPGVFTPFDNMLNVGI